MSIANGKCDLCGKDTGHCLLTDRWDKNGKVSSVNVMFCSDHSESEVKNYVDHAYLRNPKRNDDIANARDLSKL
jgi:hypothetical protein